MTNEQIIIANTATELLRAMLMNPSVSCTNAHAYELPALAVGLATTLHAQLMQTFSIPLPNYLSPPGKNA